MKKLYSLFASFIFVVGVHAQIVDIPDANFKAKLLMTGVAEDLLGNALNIDADADGEIQLSEASQVSKLHLWQSNIASLEGITSFTNLRKLNCANNQLVSLDLNGLNLTEIICEYNLISTLQFDSSSNLEYLNCKSNDLSELNLTGLIHLEVLWADNNHLTSLDVGELTNLIQLQCSVNEISTLDVSNLPQLAVLKCGYNEINSLDVSNNTQLAILSCHSNNISSIDLNGLTNLLQFSCDENPISSLDFSDNSQLDTVTCSYTQIIHLDFSNLNNLWQFFCDSSPFLEVLLINNNYPFSYSYYHFSDCPALRFICVDDVHRPTIENKIIQYGYTNCVANSYCSFTPGGTFYTVNGNAQFDANNNGCDSSDDIVPSIKFSISNENVYATLVPNATGNYSVPVGAGTHLITPIIENPSYFTVMPSSANVEFPAQASPFTQNFCIAANGIHNDLEVTLLPVDVALPGFDVNYKLICKNKGTTTQNALLVVVFDDAVLDVVSANPASSGQATNSVTWSLDNLSPFETRVVTLTLNLNSPTEMPAVNMGDVLHYTATINGNTDETSSDNYVVLNQPVVNSFDPNDKNCLEGNTVSPEMIGGYVHYRIRFENTGSANAQNVVVRDVIDLTKFDIGSLVPLEGSHPFITRIGSNNQVEFIFENIQLPFDDANNDGYVVFKIKTKLTLVVGDTFSNSASIYFDYNFPIVTNTATTTIQSLGNPDFDFGSVFTLSPVPTGNTLAITSNQAVEIKSASIFNMLGQLLQIETNPNESIDVSGLKTGSYFIRLDTDKGASSSKFLKE